MAAGFTFDQVPDLGQPAANPVIGGGTPDQTGFDFGTVPFAGPTVLGQPRPPGEAAKSGDVSWGDWYQAAKSGLGSTISGLGAAGEYVAGAGGVFSDIQQYGQDVSKQAATDMSETARARFQESLSDTLGSGHFLSSLMLKGIAGGVSTIPSLVGAVAASAVTGGAAIPAIVGAGIAGIQGAGGTYDEIQQAFDAIKKQDLAKASPYFKSLIDKGMDEKQAREQLAKEMAGAAPLAAGIVSGLTARYLGLESMVAQRLAGVAVARGILARGAAGFTGEGAQEALEQISQNVGKQDALIASGAQKGFDFPSLLKETFEAGVVGGVIGGGTNVVIGSGHTPPGPDTNQPGGEGQSPDQQPAGGPLPGPPGGDPGTSSPGGIGAPPTQPAGDPAGAAAAKSAEPTPVRQPPPTGGAAATPSGPTVETGVGQTEAAALGRVDVEAAAPEPVDDTMRAALKARIAGIPQQQPIPDVAPPAPPVMPEPGPAIPPIQGAPQTESVPETPGVTGTEPPPPPFQVSGEWQEAPRDFIFQPGLEFRFDQTTGKQFVRDPNFQAAPAAGGSFTFDEPVFPGEPTPAQAATPAPDLQPAATPPPKGRRAKAPSQRPAAAVVSEPAPVAPHQEPAPVASASAAAPAAAPSVEATPRGLPPDVRRPLPERLQRPWHKLTPAEREEVRAHRQSELERINRLRGGAPQQQPSYAPTPAPTQAPEKKVSPKRAASIEQVMETYAPEGVLRFERADIRRRAAERMAAEPRQKGESVAQHVARRGHEVYAELEGEETRAAERAGARVDVEREVSRETTAQEEKREAKQAEPRKKTRGATRTAEDVAGEQDRTTVSQAREQIARHGEAAPEWARLAAEAAEVRRTGGAGSRKRAAQLMSEARTKREASLRQAEPASATQEERIEAKLEPEEQRLAKEREAARAEHAEVERVAENAVKAAPELSPNASLEQVKAWADGLPASAFQGVPQKNLADRDPYTRLLVLARRLRSGKPSIERYTDFILGYQALTKGGRAEFESLFASDDAIERAQTGTQTLSEPDDTPGLDDIVKEEWTKPTGRFGDREMADNLLDMAVPFASQVQNARGGYHDILKEGDRRPELELSDDERTIVSRITGFVLRLDPRNIYTAKTLLERVSPGRVRDPALTEIIDAAILRHYPNMPVYVVSRADMFQLRGSMTSFVWGSHSTGQTPDSPGVLVLNEAMFDFEAQKLVRQAYDPDFPGQTLRHELTHLLSQNALNNEANPFTQAMKQLWQDARRSFEIRYGKEPSEIYGLRDVHEFVAEGYNNPRFQSLLDGLGFAPETTVQQIEGLVGRPSLFKRFLVNVLGLFGIRPRPEAVTFMNALVRLSRDNLMLGPQESTAQGRAQPMGFMPGAYATLAEAIDVGLATRSSIRDSVSDWFTNQVNGAAENASAISHSRRGAREWWSKKWLAAQTMWDLGRMARRDGFFQTGDDGRTVIDRINETLGKIGVTNQRLKQGSDALVRDLKKLYQGMTESQRTTFDTLIYSSTNHQSDASQPLKSAENGHITKGITSTQKRATWQRNKAIYDALPADQKAMYKRIGTFFRENADALAHDLLNSQLSYWEKASANHKYPPGYNRAKVIQWVLNGGIDRQGDDRTPDDIDLHVALGALARQLKGAEELRNIKGYYFPLMRRGTHVNYGREEVDVPAGAQLLPGDNKNQLAFAPVKPNAKSAPDAEAWLANPDNPMGKFEWWYVNQNGDLVAHDDPDAVAKVPVITVNNEFVEFYDSLPAAQDAHAQLKKDGKWLRLAEPQERNRFFSGYHELMPRQLAAQMHGIEAMFPGDDQAGTRELYKSILSQAAARSMQGVRVQQRRLLRRNVKGFSTDTEQNIADFGSSNANYRARLKHDGEVTRLMGEAGKEIKAGEFSAGSGARQRFWNEFQSRVERSVHQHEILEPEWMRVWRQTAFLKYLVTPRYMLTNATQTMLAFTKLAAKFGMVPAYRALRQAWKDMNALALLTKGAKGYVDIRSAVAGEDKDFLADIHKALGRTADKDEILSLLRTLEEVGTIDNDIHGIEAEQIWRRPPSGGVLAEFGATRTLYKSLDVLTRLGRTGPKAVEFFNRVAPAIAIYRLERAAGTSHDKAILAANDLVTETQFDYRAWNMPKWFQSQNPLIKMALMFKKYPLGIGLFIGHNMQNMIRAYSGGDRQVAIQSAKVLMGVFLMHFLFAGAAGALPTELLQGILFGLSQVGLWSGTWDDNMFELRRWIGKTIGSQWTADLLMKGPLRQLLGIDLSNSINLDSLFTFDRPKEMTKDAWMAWFGGQAMGPMGGQVLDFVRGLYGMGGAIKEGDFNEFLRGAERVSPVKWSSDALRAARLGLYGEKQGARQYAKPPSIKDTVLRATLGLKPEAESIEQEKSFYQRRQKTATAAARTRLMGNLAAAVQAKNEAKRVKAISAIRDWNRTHKGKELIEPKDIQQSIRARRTNEQTRQRELRELQ